MKTKQTVSSVRDYFPTKPKASCIDASILHNKHSQYQAMIVDKSKPSTAASILIDNHVTRVASRQEVSAITRQTSSTVEVIPPPPVIVSTKPKTSQSISSPPQVNLINKKPNDCFFVFQVNESEQVKHEIYFFTIHNSLFSLEVMNKSLLVYQKSTKK